MGKFLKSNVNPKVGELAYVDGISVAQVILPAPPSYHSTTPAVPHSLFLFLSNLMYDDTFLTY